MKTSAITFYTFAPHESWLPQYQDEIQSDIASQALPLLGPLELATSGFVAPAGFDRLELAPRIGDNILVSLETTKKILPGAVIHDAVRQRVAEIELREDRKLGSRQRRAIRDQVTLELLPQAFSKRSTVDAIIMPDIGVIAVCTGSRNAADRVVHAIRQARGSFPALPLNAEVAPRTVLTGWVAGELTPDGTYVGSEAVMREAAGSGRITARDVDIRGPEIAAHLAAGMFATSVEVYLGDRAQMNIGEDMVLRKFRLLDAAFDPLEGQEIEDQRAEAMARATILAGTIRETIAAFWPAFRISMPERGAA